MLDLVLEHDLGVVGGGGPAGVEEGRPEEVPVQPGPVVAHDEGGLVRRHRVAGHADRHAQETRDEGLENVKNRVIYLRIFFENYHKII